MEKARQAGKTKFIGLSAVSEGGGLCFSCLLSDSSLRSEQMSANTLRRAAKCAKIDFVEVEHSLFEVATLEVRRCFSELVEVSSIDGCPSFRSPR